MVRTRFILLCGLICALCYGGSLFAQDKVRIGHIGLSLSSLPLVAARERGFFSRNGVQAEVVLLTSQLSAVALNSGSCSMSPAWGRFGERTLAGSPSRAVWIVANRMIYDVIAQPELKTLQDLRGKRIGVSGLGATTHTAFTMAIEKTGANPKDFVVVALGPQQHQRAMVSKSVDAMIVDPPVSFVLLKKGFNKVLDIGAAVEMPVGGLTTLTKTLDGKPDQVRRVIKALQQAKESLIGSRERSVGFIVKTMNMEPEIAVKTFDLMAFAWAGSGVPP